MTATRGANGLEHDRGLDTKGKLHRASCIVGFVRTAAAAEETHRWCPAMLEETLAAAEGLILEAIGELRNPV